MTTSDAKSYLANREIPQLFEVFIFNITND